MVKLLTIGLQIGRNGDHAPVSNTPLNRQISFKFYYYQF